MSAAPPSPPLCVCEGVCGRVCAHSFAARGASVGGWGSAERRTHSAELIILIIKTCRWDTFSSDTRGALKIRCSIFHHGHALGYWCCFSQVLTRCLQLPRMVFSHFSFCWKMSFGEWSYVTAALLEAARAGETLRLFCAQQKSWHHLATRPIVTSPPPLWVQLFIFFYYFFQSCNLEFLGLKSDVLEIFRSDGAQRQNLSAPFTFSGVFIMNVFTGSKTQLQDPNQYFYKPQLHILVLDESLPGLLVLFLLIL